MKIRMVKFFRLKPRMSTHEVVLELFMDENLDIIDGGALSQFGKDLLEQLRNSSIKVNDKDLTFVDKETYLRNLNTVYDSAYLTASKYTMQDSELAK